MRQIEDLTMENDRNVDSIRKNRDMNRYNNWIRLENGPRFVQTWDPRNIQIIGHFVVHGEACVVLG